MRISFIIFYNELKIFSRNRLQIAGIAVFLLLGLYSIYYGTSSIKNDNTRTRYLSDSIRSVQAVYAAALQADTTSASGKYRYETAALPSLVRFNYNFLVASRPSPFAALSLGQRDMYPSYYILNAQSLYVQTLKGEISNPFKLSAGNFDLAFVFIYLLPLIVIALGFDLLSGENETGIVPLLRVGNYSLRTILLIKLAFRFVLTTCIIFMLSLIAFGATGIALFTLPAAVWLLVAVVYNLLWHTIILLINSFNRSSAFNAMVALGTWVLLLIAIPVVVNAAVQNKGINAIALSTLMRSRNMPETDEAMFHALDKFYRYYPGKKPAQVKPKGYFYFQGYSAFLYNTDQDAAQLVDSFTQAVKTRAACMDYFTPVNPAVNTLQLFNAIAQTDMSSSLAFKKEVAAFHKKIFWFSNKALFDNRYMNAADYAQAPVFLQVQATALPAPLFRKLALLILLAGICCILAFANLREKKLYR